MFQAEAYPDLKNQKEYIQPHSGPLREVQPTALIKAAFCWKKETEKGDNVLPVI